LLPISEPEVEPRINQMSQVEAYFDCDHRVLSVLLVHDFRENDHAETVYRLKTDYTDHYSYWSYVNVVCEDSYEQAGYDHIQSADYEGFSSEVVAPYHNDCVSYYNSNVTNQNWKIYSPWLSATSKVSKFIG